MLKYKSFLKNHSFFFCFCSAVHFRLLDKTRVALGTCRGFLPFDPTDSLCASVFAQKFKCKLSSFVLKIAAYVILLHFADGQWNFLKFCQTWDVPSRAGLKAVALEKKRHPFLSPKFFGILQGNLQKLHSLAAFSPPTSGIAQKNSRFSKWSRFWASKLSGKVF